uniref:DSL domain-containing protein n=1 Tax=Angiostrongylus cantonensis TaxID=6313 RepID=A0A0K0D2U1_ANGCA
MEPIRRILLNMMRFVTDSSLTQEEMLWHMVNFSVHQRFTALHSENAMEMQGWFQNSGIFQNNVESSNGVTIQFQLRGYSNPQSALPNGWTCVCPSGYNCNYLKSSPTCYFGFTFIISAPDTSVRHLATDFITLDASGQLPSAQRNGWDQNYIVQLPSKPHANISVHINFIITIDIFVHHLGADGSLVSVDTLTHVDTFVVPMSQQHAYQGKLLGTTLYLSYSISCTGSLIGPNCDLTCTQSPISLNTASCRSNATGFFYVCTFQSGGQVDNCKSCPWGIKESTYCQDEEGGVLDPYHAGVVDTGYRTATIVLSITSVIFFILFILALITLCVL